MSFFFKKVENFILGEDNTLEIAQRKADGEDRVELLVRTRICCSRRTGAGFQLRHDTL